MSYTLEIKEDALEDIQTVYQYYEEAVEGLGEDFINELEEFTIILEKNPYLFEVKYNPFREAKINRFPYLIIYEIENSNVTIYAIFHTSQSPKKRYKK